MSKYSKPKALLLGAMAAAAVAAAASSAATADGSADLLGFSAAGAAAELALEQRFDADISAADLSAWMQQMASEPNQVGAPHLARQRGISTRQVPRVGIRRRN